jgi:hypothetical protein
MCNQGGSGEGYKQVEEAILTMITMAKLKKTRKVATKKAGVAKSFYDNKTGSGFNANIAWSNEEQATNRPIAVYKQLRGVVGKMATTFPPFDINRKWKQKPKSEDGLMGIFTK